MVDYVSITDDALRVLDPSDGSEIRSYSQNVVTGQNSDVDDNGKFYFRQFDFGGNFEQGFARIPNDLSATDWVNQTERSNNCIRSYPNGEVVVCNDDNYVEMVNADGTEKWATDISATNASILTARGACLSNDRTAVYVVGDGRIVEEFDASNGSYVTTHNLEAVAQFDKSDIVQDKNGDFYIATIDGQIQKHDSSYNNIWLYNPSWGIGDANYQMALGMSDSHVSVAGDSGVSKVAHDGTVAWEQSTSDSGNQTAIGQNGAVYAAFDDSTFKKFASSDGTEQWSVATNAGDTGVTAFPQWNQYPDAWGPSVAQVTATQIAAAAGVSVGTVSELLSATQVQSAATMESPTLLEVLAAAQASSTATMEQVSLLELISSTQVQSSAGVNTAALLEFAQATQPAAAARVFTADTAFRVSLTATQFAATSSMGVPKLKEFTQAAQSDVSATTLQAAATPSVAIAAAQVAAQSDMNDVSLNVVLQAVQASAATSMNTIPGLNEALEAAQTDAQATVNDVLIDTVIVDAAQATAAATMLEGVTIEDVTALAQATSATATSNTDVRGRFIGTATPTSGVVVIPIRARFNPRRVDVAETGDEEENDAELTSGRNNWVSND